MKPDEIWRKAAHWSGIDLSDDAIGRLYRYREWLVEEAVPSGGLGPAEIDRLDRRHIGDSLLFASQMDSDIDEAWDLGSGVGLPGIPLAITHPGAEFSLVDRSGRRCRFLRRVIKILDLANVEVIQGEIEAIPPQRPLIVSRAVLPPDVARVTIWPLLASGGVAIVGGSWRQEPLHPGWTTIHIPAAVLDQSVWLLMMRRP